MRVEGIRQICGALGGGVNLVPLWNEIDVMPGEREARVSVASIQRSIPFQSQISCFAFLLSTTYSYLRLPIRCRNSLKLRFCRRS